MRQVAARLLVTCACAALLATPYPSDAKLDLLRPQMLAPACTEGLVPEINDDLEVSECLLLPRRVVWRGGLREPLLIRQTWDARRMGSQSTGTSVWAGGLALSRYMESLGPSYFAGKHVVELGSGTGVASITAVKLGAASAVATDRDPRVLSLASSNARDNLSAGARAAFSTAVVSWGEPVPSGLGGTDLVLGADLTYNRDAWPALVKTIRALDAPALLSVSERRPNELESLMAFLSEAKLRYTVISSPLQRGYAAEKVRLLSIEKPGDEECDMWTEETFGPESTLVVECQPPRKPS